MKDMMKAAYDKKKKRPVPLAPLALLAVFTGGMLTYLLAVLPFLIDHGGLFFYYGDYNVQQVPFLILEVTLGVPVCRTVHGKLVW